MARRRIDPVQGAHAVRAWAARFPAGQEPTPTAAAAGSGGGQAAGAGTAQARAVGSSSAAPSERAALRRQTATAVRYTLEELAACAPGHSVEVRVPPFGATQAVAGTVHRRGTPPSVVETDAATWLALATGRLTWADAVASGRLQASGERCDLSAYLPLVPGLAGEQE